VASWNNDRIDAYALTQEPPLKFDGKEAVVSPDDRRSGNVGPSLDIAPLSEGNVDFIPRIGQYRSSLLRREVVEKVRLKVEIGVVSASLSSSDPSVDRTGGRPPLPGRLSGAGTIAFTRMSPPTGIRSQAMTALKPPIDCATTTGSAQLSMASMINAAYSGSPALGSEPGRSTGSA